MEQTQTATVSLVKETLVKGITYNEYREQVAEHVGAGTSTGPEQTEALSQYTLLNDSRMRRLDKTTLVAPEIAKLFEEFHGNQTWLVLTESWCGDAAQSLPMINKLAELSPNINLKVALRDENLELMEQFLTNGSLSIPKLIVMDNETNSIIKEWGPRPTIATKMVSDFKREHGSLTPEFKQDLQIWYNKDKSKNIAEDLIHLLD